MATNKPRFSVTFSEDTFQKIQVYQSRDKISTQSKAVSRLVEMALDNIERKKSERNALNISEEALKLAGDYDGLDEHGKRVVRVVTDEEKSRMKQDTKPTPDEPSKQENGIDIEAEVAEYRRQLLLQKEAEERSSSLSDTEFGKMA